MNLTSKRMLQIIAGCAGAFALVATAADPVKYISDSFEATDSGSNLLPIGLYKQVLSAPDGNGVVTTNPVWLAQSGDASKLVATGVPGYLGVNRPTSNDVPVEYVLNLETEGQTLVRTNSTSLDFGGTPVYVDSLIKFTPSEDNPTINDGAVKAAVFVNVVSNLFIYHGVDGLPPEITDTGIKIVATNWYRLTILLQTRESLGKTAFQVYLDGMKITNSPAAYNDTGSQGTADASWFLNASVDTHLSGVAFQGTGMVDDLVVTDQANGISTSVPILLTLSFGSGIDSVLTNGAPALTGAVVPTGTEVVINASPWYHLGAPAPDAVSVFNQTFSSDSCKTGTVTSTASEGMSFSASINMLTVSYNDAQLTSAVANGGSIAADSAFSIAPVAVNERHVVPNALVTGGKIYGANGATVTIDSALNALHVSYGAALAGTVASGAAINATDAFSIGPVDADIDHVTDVTGGTISGGQIYGLDGATVTIGSAVNQLSVSFDSGLTANDGGVLTSPASVNANTTLEVAANQWKRISGKSGTASWTGTASGTSSSGTVKGTNGAYVVFSSAAVANGQLTLPAGFGGDVPTVSAWVAAHAPANSTEADLTTNAEAWLKDYLFNVDAGTNPKLVIESITVDETAGTVTFVITTDKKATVTNFAGINGVLKYLATDDLGTPFSGATTVSVVGAGDSVTKTIDIVSGAKFIKATIE